MLARRPASSITGVVSSHAATFFEQRKNVMKVLRGELEPEERLPAEHQRAVAQALQQAHESGPLLRAEGLRQRLFFGHEDVVRHVQPQNVPAGAREFCCEKVAT